MDILVTGGSGLLGREITRQAVEAGDRVVATFHSTAGQVSGADWRRLDITRREDVAALVAEVRPDVIVNTAYRQSDWTTTAEGAMHVAAAAAATGSRLVQVSSEAVFSGAAVTYDENAKPDPEHPYGAAKAAAEVAVAGLVPDAVIARVSLILGSRGDSPTERLVHGLADGTRSGALFTDEVRCAVHVSDLAAALLELARSASPDVRGVHHLAGTDPLTRHELGVLIARRDGLDETALPAGSRAASGVPGALDVRLVGAATQARLATKLRGAREFLQE